MDSTRAASLPPSKPLDLEITVVSAKHLKNVNWRHGDINPYAVAYLDPDRRISTKPDDVGSTKPVWNERLLLSIPTTDDPATVLLTIDLFHSRLSVVTNPLIGTARCPLSDLIDLTTPSRFLETSPIKILDVRRPSGRPQGKIRIRIRIRERPAPPPLAPPSPYFSTIPAPHPPPQDYSRYSPSAPVFVPPPHPSEYAPQYPYMSFFDPYRGHNPTAPVYASNSGMTMVGGYCMPPRSYYGGPSAQVDYSPGSVSYHEQKQKGNIRTEVGSGLAVGAIAGALGGLALEEGLKLEEEKVAERMGNHPGARDDYRDYHGDY